MAELIQVKAVQDNDGHWYVIPKDLFGQFHKDLDGDEDEFIDKYDKYRTNGDLNNIQLWADINF